MLLNLFLIQVLEGGKWSTSPPGHFTPGKEPAMPPEQDAGQRPRAGLHGMKKN